MAGRSRRGTSTFVVPRASTLEETEVSKRECADALRWRWRTSVRRPPAGGGERGVSLLFVPVANLTALSPRAARRERPSSAISAPMARPCISTRWTMRATRISAPHVLARHRLARRSRHRCRRRCLPFGAHGRGGTRDGHQRVRIGPGRGDGAPSLHQSRLHGEGRAVAQATIAARPSSSPRCTLHV